MMASVDDFVDVRPVHMYATRRSPRKRWLRRAVLAETGLVAILGIYFGLSSPPEHDVSSYGGVKVAYTADWDGSYPVYALGPLAPTVSLSVARCEAWHIAHSGICPDDAALAVHYWPRLEDRSHQLYVGLFSCDPSPQHLNLEYSANRLYIHCHSSGPLVSIGHRGEQITPAPTIALLVVPTSGMSVGPLSVVEEDRVERWIADKVSQTALGVVTITS